MVGTIQTLGAHMLAGGGAGGFIASRDEERYAREYPTLNISIAPTDKPGEHGFALSLAHQSSYGMREEGKDWTGNSVYLTTIGCAAYMALLGPQGFAEIGEVIVQRATTRRSCSEPSRACGSPSAAASSRNSCVNFDGAGKTVAEVNDALRARGIFGGARPVGRLPAARAERALLP